MVRLILVRHGETTWNAERRYQGYSDVLLSEVGKRQAATLVRELARVEIHAIYTSDLRRAWETAAAIAAPHGLLIRSEPRLREINFGAWEGLTYEEISTGFPEALAAWQADPIRVAPPNGETMAAVVDRIRAVFEGMTRVHQGETVVLVAHGGSLQILICLALGLTPRARWQFHLNPGSLSELHLYPEGAVLTGLNFALVC